MFLLSYDITKTDWIASVYLENADSVMQTNYIECGQSCKILQNVAKCA